MPNDTLPDWEAVLSAAARLQGICLMPFWWGALHPQFMPDTDYRPTQTMYSLIYASVSNRCCSNWSP